MRALLTFHRDHVGSLLTQLLVAVTGALVLTVAAKVQIPLGLIKASLQPTVVLCLGFLLGTRMALLVIATYLFEGALGLPVFQSSPERGVGLAYMAGPTAGYLVGFAVAAWMTGTFRHRAPSVLGTLALTTAATVALYLCGVLWLGKLLGSIEQALQVGVIPFLPTAVLQIALAATIAQIYLSLKKRSA